LLRFDDVSFSRAQTPVLHNLSFTVSKVERVAIIGPNGAGKSTLLKLCNGLYHPIAGMVYIDEKETTSLRASQIAKYVGFMFQNPDRQLFSDSIEVELAFGLKLQDLPEASIRTRTQEMLDLFGLQSGINPLLASRSLRQRIALASLVAPHPRLLLLDEPTTGLDHRDRRMVLDILEKLNTTDDTAIVIITHDMELVQTFARRALVLLDGRLVADGEHLEILRDESLLESASLAPPQMLGLLSRLRDIGQADDIDGLVELIKKKVTA
jgi:energy-coupling factor transport system ATP-binding protein